MMRRRSFFAALALPFVSAAAPAPASARPCPARAPAAILPLRRASGAVGVAAAKGLCFIDDAAPRDIAFGERLKAAVLSADTVWLRAGPHGTRPAFDLSRARVVPALTFPPAPRRPFPTPPHRSLPMKTIADVLRLEAQRANQRALDLVARAAEAGARSAAIDRLAAAMGNVPTDRWPEARHLAEEVVFNGVATVWEGERRAPVPVRIDAFVASLPQASVVNQATDATDAAANGVERLRQAVARMDGPQ